MTRFTTSGASLVLALGLALVAGCDDSGGTGVTPDYTLTVDPTTLTILPGEAGTTTVTADTVPTTGAAAIATDAIPTTGATAVTTDTIASTTVTTTITTLAATEFIA